MSKGHDYVRIKGVGIGGRTTASHVQYKMQAVLIDLL